MFITDQMPKIAEMHDEMQDVLVEITALNSPITSVYDIASTHADYVLQISQWYDLLNCLLFV